MKKLSLDIDALTVESFEAEPPAAGRGTVHGHSYPNHCLPASNTADPFIDTCQYATCAGTTCYGSCNGTCSCGGSAGCQQESMGPTYCFKDYSCMAQCL